MCLACKIWRFEIAVAKYCPGNDIDTSQEEIDALRDYVDVIIEKENEFQQQLDGRAANQTNADRQLIVQSLSTRSSSNTRMEYLLQSDDDDDEYSDNNSVVEVAKSAGDKDSDDDEVKVIKKTKRKKNTEANGKERKLTKTSANFSTTFESMMPSLAETAITFMKFQMNLQAQQEEKKK